jgi:hypothetical protein
MRVSIPRMTIITIHFANCSRVGRLTGKGRRGGPVMFRRYPRPLSAPTAKIPSAGCALAGADSAGSLPRTACMSLRRPNLSALGSIKHRPVILALTV